MNIINKMISFIKNIFSKKEEIKKLEAPKEILHEEKRSNFVTILKNTSMKKSKIETLICVGDGLGIKKQIKY